MAIVIRPLETIQEFHQAEEVQRQIWGFVDVEVVPLHTLLTVAKNDGLVLGAFDGEQMVGMLFGFLGRGEDGRLKHCSHLMGVIPSYRQQGIGLLLKLEQRKQVLTQGLDLVTWTFDPLETHNAYLNLHKLGGICRRYLKDIYGDIRDDLNRGLPTDRFEVQWWPQQESVTYTLDEGEKDGLVTTVKFDNRDFPKPVAYLSPDAAQSKAALVEVPAAFQTLKAKDMALALEWRQFTRDAFTAYLSSGYMAVDLLSRVDDGRRRCFYLLCK